MTPEQIEIERVAFEAARAERYGPNWTFSLSSPEDRAAWDFWLARAEKAQRVRNALENYMAAFGQGLEANGIPYGPQQQEADAAARAALKD